MTSVDRLNHRYRLCSECADGYFHVIQRCYPCRNSAGVAAAFVFLLVVWYMINVVVSRNVASLEIALHWAQLANVIGDIHLKWTDMVVTLFGIASLLDFDVDIMQPSCSARWGFRQRFLLQLGLPFLMTVMGCSGYLGSALAYVLHKHQWVKLDGRKRRLLSFFVHLPENDTQLMQKWDATIATLLASVDTTYITIAKYCFDVFKCTTVASVSVLRADPSVVCDEEHMKTVILAIMGILIFVIGYPAFIGWKLYCLRAQGGFVDSVQLRRYGFIYEKYELDYYFTPAIDILRKLLFVFVLVYVNNPAFQVGAISVIINASLMVHIYTAPYVNTYLDVLFSFLLVALLFEAFGGLMFYSENLPDANREILEWLVLITSLMLVVVFAMIFAAEITNKWYTVSLKKRHQCFATRKEGDGIGSQLVSTVINSAITQVVLDTVRSKDADKTISFELLDTFKPAFVYRCLQKNPEHIKNWDRLTDMLKDYVADNSETSYLSTDPVARFWRRLVDQFPQLVDFLAVADEDSRNKFNDFATNLYRNFYLSKKVEPLPLMHVVNWRDYAPLAQWLAIATTEEREFFLSFVSELFETADMKAEADALRQRSKTGGPDPHLQYRRSKPCVNRRGKTALQHIANGSHPFHHSAAERKISTAATVAIGVSKFRLSRLRSKKKLLSALQATQMHPDTVPLNTIDEQGCEIDRPPTESLEANDNNRIDSRNGASRVLSEPQDRIPVIADPPRTSQKSKSV